ncbi:MAG: hypothetical protein Ct9H300mP1_26090 [Planctomycetaceae bacterium]|nr:MAG: hypothetical protein Ct9H300mP1_26090 [Planctomycetaceae bacterium]
MVLDWGSQRPQVLTRGAALCTWQDPSKKTEWVVVGQRLGRAGSYFYRNLSKVRLDDPSVSRPVGPGPGSVPTISQLSRDGNLPRASSRGPTGPGPPRPPLLTHLGKGCWASLLLTTAAWHGSSTARTATSASKLPRVVPNGRSPSTGRPRVPNPPESGLPPRPGSEMFHPSGATMCGTWG